MVQHAARLAEQNGAKGGDLARGQKRAHVAERFMERGGLDRARFEELGPNRVENRMSHLVAADVGALTREVRAPRDSVVEEV